METCSHPFVGAAASFHENIDMQATMFQPKAAWTPIPRALEAALPPGSVRKGAVVTRIARRGSGVAVEFKRRGKAERLEADYAVITIPLCVLSGIPNDLSPDRKAVTTRASTARL